MPAEVKFRVIRELARRPTRGTGSDQLVANLLEREDGERLLEVGFLQRRGSRWERTRGVEINLDDLLALSHLLKDAFSEVRPTDRRGPRP
jgi:hypothetical protein